MFFISNVTLKSLRKKSMTVLSHFLCINGIQYGTKDIFLTELRNVKVRMYKSETFTYVVYFFFCKW